MIKSKLCECGCGDYAKPGNRFINGHNGRKPKPEPKLCECGCGDYAKPGDRFIYGHNRRGTTISDEHKRAIAESIMGDKNPAKRLSVRKKISDSLMGHEVSDETRQKISVGNKGRKNSIESNLKRSESGKLHHEKHPERGERQSRSMKKHYMDLGGCEYDIVGHHIAYDFNRPEAFIVKITRRRHGQIHSPKGSAVTEHGYSLID